MARLLVGMHEPDTGIITIGGQKISEIELECLRKHIIYVSQIPVLLSGTIREGLLFGCTHSINDELFERIAHGCGVDEIIRDNPFGYDWILTGKWNECVRQVTDRELQLQEHYWQNRIF